MTFRGGPGLQQIFEEALHRSGFERETYLNEVCAGNPELLREVESLLATATQDGLTQTVDFSDSAGPLSLPDVGDGRYVLQALIGRGGMGQVYRAQDRQLDRLVAIKAI
ncbi:MAG TPA: hypothetical protein VF424_02400, partial [Vicinamibacterales bacterium]